MPRPCGEPDPRYGHAPAPALTAGLAGRPDVPLDDMNAAPTNKSAPGCMWSERPLRAMAGGRLTDLIRVCEG